MTFACLRDVDGSAKDCFNSVDYFPLAALKMGWGVVGGRRACMSSLSLQKSKALQERDEGRSRGHQVSERVRSGLLSSPNVKPADGSSGDVYWVYSSVGKDPLLSAEAVAQEESTVTWSQPSRSGTPAPGFREARGS